MDDKFGLSHEHVFSDSVLCVGGSVMSDATGKWERKFFNIRDGRTFLKDLASQVKHVVYIWHVFSRLTSKQWLQKV